MIEGQFKSLDNFISTFSTQTAAVQVCRGWCCGSLCAVRETWHQRNGSAKQLCALTLQSHVLGRGG